MDWEGIGGNLPYAADVKDSEFKKVCQERAPREREEGYYLMYSGGLFRVKAPDGTPTNYWYVITAGLCEVAKSDQFYTGNVTCCPQ